MARCEWYGYIVFCLFSCFFNSGVVIEYDEICYGDYFVIYCVIVEFFLNVFYGFQDFCQLCWVVDFLVFLWCQMNVCIIGIVLFVGIMESRSGVLSCGY